MTTAECRNLALTATINQLNDVFMQLEAAGQQSTIDEIVRFAKPRFARYNPGVIGKPERRRAAY